MVTVSLILAAVSVGDVAPETRLPMTRVTMLRDFGCWLQWEGEVASEGGQAKLVLPNSIDPASISVERADGPEWRTLDFSYMPPTATANASKGDAAVVLNLLIPSELKKPKIRVRAISTFLKWRPAYLLELGKTSRMTMRCLATASHGMESDSTIECTASSAIPRGGENDRWSDSTVYPWTAKRLHAGVTSLILVDGAVEAEEFTAVELGGMAGEPGVRPARDRSLSMVRLSNRSTKAWPTGEMLVTSEGRLMARVMLPHTDAGQATDVSLGAAVGVAVSRDEVELERKTAVVRRESDPPDSVLTAGSATIANHSGRAMIIRATKTVAGDATAASDDAKIVRTANRLGADQPLNEIRWHFTLPAGQSRRLTYGTTIRMAPPSEAKDSKP